MRLDKFLSNKGFGSRKEVSQLIRKGKVRVNQIIVKDPSLHIDPEKDLIEIDGKPLDKGFSYFYYKFYKPKGYITSTKDKQPTVMELLPSYLPGRHKIFPVGRLDKDAEGLLIFTNDGQLAHRMLHPKWKLPKIYEVVLDKPLFPQDKQVLEAGIELSDGKTSPCEIKYLDSSSTNIKITVYEGRYHLLKRMFGKLGYKVLGIKRIAIGPITLEDPKVRQIKPLSEQEINALKKMLFLTEDLAKG